MNLDPKYLFERLAFKFLVLWMLVLVLVLYGCGGSKIKKSRSYAVTKNEQVETKLNNTHKSDLKINTKEERLEGKSVYTPINPNMPMLAPDAGGDFHPTQNAIVEHSYFWEKKDESSTDKSVSETGVFIEGTNSGSVNIKDGDVHRKGIGTATMSLI